VEATRGEDGEEAEGDRLGGRQDEEAVHAPQQL
jgi:hypothetical protein